MLPVFERVAYDIHAYIALLLKHLIRRIKAYISTQNKQ